MGEALLIEFYAAIGLSTVGYFMENCAGTSVFGTDAVSADERLNAADAPKSASCYSGPDPHGRNGEQRRITGRKTDGRYGAEISQKRYGFAIVAGE